MDLFTQVYFLHALNTSMEVIDVLCERKHANDGDRHFYLRQDDIGPMVEVYINDKLFDIIEA